MEANMNVSIFPRYQTLNEEEAKRVNQERVDEQSLRNLMRRGGFFGSREWEEIYGIQVEQVALPANVLNILEERCPYGKEEKVKDSHFLTLIPREVTIGRMGELEGGFCKNYSYGLRQTIGGIPVPQLNAVASHWSLMYVGSDHGLLPGSRSKSFQDQCTLMKGGYEVIPLVDAFLSILSHFRQTEERLVPDAPWSWIQCAEKYDNGWRVMMGRICGGGLCRPYCYDERGYHNLGLGVLRKF